MYKFQQFAIRAKLSYLTFIIVLCCRLSIKLNVLSLFSIVILIYYVIQVNEIFALEMVMFARVLPAVFRRYSHVRIAARKIILWKFFQDILMLEWLLVRALIDRRLLHLSSSPARNRSQEPEEINRWQKKRVSQEM